MERASLRQVQFSECRRGLRQLYSPVICFTTTSESEIDLEGAGFDGDGVLQGFQQGNVFGDVVVLVADPLGDAGGLAAGAFDDDADAGGSRVTVRSAVDVGYQIGHSAPDSPM